MASLSLNDNGHRQKGIKLGFVTPGKSFKFGRFCPAFRPNVKKVRTPHRQGLDPGEISVSVFRFVYKKAANDKMVPDPVGSEAAQAAKLSE
jgi:hypothetical protein